MWSAVAAEPSSAALRLVIGVPEGADTRRSRRPAIPLPRKWRSFGRRLGRGSPIDATRRLDRQVESSQSASLMTTPPQPQEEPPLSSPTTDTSPPPGADAESRSPRFMPAGVSRILRRYLLPIGLALLAAGSGVGVIILLPDRSPISTPLSPTLYVDAGSGDVGVIRYSVVSSGHNRWAVTISMEDDVDAGQTTVGVQLVLLPGSRFLDCVTACSNDGASGATYHPSLVLLQKRMVSRTVDVSSKPFGYATNGLDASVALPELLYTGHVQPSFYVHAAIRNAQNYGWTGVAPEFLSPTGAQWLELSASAPITSNAVQQEVAPNNATGVNPAAQDDDNRLTFLAGALLGVGGGALIAALQESVPLVAEDRRKRRSGGKPSADLDDSTKS